MFSQACLLQPRVSDSSWEIVKSGWHLDPAALEWRSPLPSSAMWVFSVVFSKSTKFYLQKHPSYMEKAAAICKLFFLLHIQPGLGSWKKLYFHPSSPCQPSGFSYHRIADSPGEFLPSHPIALAFLLTGHRVRLLSQLSLWRHSHFNVLTKPPDRLPTWILDSLHHTS